MVEPTGSGGGSRADRPIPIVGAVLCGGRSSRFGSDKALAPFRSSTMGERVVDALRKAGVDPVVAIGGRAGDDLAIPTVPDRRPGDGPLAALATALLWARTGRVVVAPCDLPLLQADHIGLLLDAVIDPTDPDWVGPVVATVDGQPQVSLSIWPATEGRRLLRLVDGGERRFRAALQDCPWRGAEVPVEALADADTEAELSRLEKGAD